MTLDELVQMMAGGAELEALSHELARQMPDSEVVQELESEVAETLHVDPDEARRATPRAPDRDRSPRDRCRGGGVRLDGPGALACVGAPAPALPRRPAAAPARGRGRPRRRPRASTRSDAYGFAERRRRLARRCSSATTSTWSASADRTSCTARWARRSPASGRHLWIEKPAGRSAEDTAAIAAAVHDGGRAVGRRLQLPQRPGRRACPRAGRRRARSAAWSRSTSGCSPTTPPTPTAPCRGASTRSTPAPACSATWPATASTWRCTSAGTASAGSPSWWPTRRPSSPSARSRPAPSRTTRAAATGRAAPVGNEDVASALLRFGVGRPRLPRRRRASPSASSAPTTIDVRGTDGALSWDFRRMGELRLCLGHGLPGRAVGDPLRAGRATATSRAFQPGSGIAMGFDDLKVVECRAPGGEHPHGQAARRDHRRRRRGGRAGRRDGAFLRGETMGDPMTTDRASERPAATPSGSASSAPAPWVPRTSTTSSRWVPGAAGRADLRRRLRARQGRRRRASAPAPPRLGRGADRVRRRRRRADRRARPAARAARRWPASRLGKPTLLREADRAARSRAAAASSTPRSRLDAGWSSSASCGASTRRTSRCARRCSTARSASVRAAHCVHRNAHGAPERTPTRACCSAR